jgi:hypothetical protein
LEAGDDNTFTCTFGNNGSSSNSGNSGNGWQGSSRLPKRLSDRLKSLGETFQMKVRVLLYYCIIVHVGGTRGVTSPGRTIRARIILTVEFLRTCIVLF